MEASLSGQLSSFFNRETFGLSGRFIRIGESVTPGQTPAAVPDPVDLGRAAAAPFRVLDTEVLDALDQALAADGLSLDRQANPADYTSQQVADRILGFIETALDRYAADDPQREQLLATAREAVIEGFAQAAGVLDGLGVMQGDLSDELERTAELVQQGLERLAAGAPAVAPAADSGTGAADPAAPTTAPATGGAAVQQVAVGGMAYSTSQVTSLVIDTVDGDRISIDISKQASVSQAAVVGQSGNARVQGFQSSLSAGVSFSFRVQGDLDEDEREAVDALLQRIDKVSERFFDGEVQDAFATAASLEFDAEELAGFSLDMRSTETYQAVAAYRQTAADTGAPAAEGSLPVAAGFGAEVAGLFDQAAATTAFAAPANDVARLFGNITEQRAASGLAELKGEAMSLLDDLVGGLVAVFGGEVESGDEAHEDAEGHDADKAEDDD